MMPLALQLVDDRAIRSVVSPAAMDQVLECLAHGFHLGHSLIQLSDVFGSNAAHIRA